MALATQPPADNFFYPQKLIAEFSNLWYSIGIILVLRNKLEIEVIYREIK